MNAQSELAWRIAESRAGHLSPAIGAVRVGPNGGIETARSGRVSVGGAALPAAPLWHIGSCTKAMTATVIARLVEQRRLSFDMLLGAALPDLAAGMSDGFRETPLADVLTHSAGIARDPEGSTFRALHRSTAPVSAQRAFLTREALGGAPRSGVGYSNLGYIVLGAVIEAATGREWEAALAREVMIPLGIGRFGFGADHPALPPGHRRKDNVWRAVAHDNPGAYGPAGRVHLALEEWGRFLRLHLGAGPKGVLSPASLSRLHQPAENGFAMGWISVAGGRRLMHTGSNTAWFAQATLEPETGRGIGIVCNAFDERIAAAVDDLSVALLDGGPGEAP